MYAYHFKKTVLVNTLFRVSAPPKKSHTQFSCIALACPYFKSEYLTFPDFGKKSAYVLCKPTFSRYSYINDEIKTLEVGDYFYASGELRTNYTIFDNVKPDLSLEIDDFYWDESGGKENKLKTFVLSSIDLSKIVNNPAKT